jgi:Undecaprenyl-phosphate glucose phosphotransferase
MPKWYQGLQGGLLRLIDLSVVVATWLLSYWVRFELSPILPVPDQALPSFSTYASLSPLVAVLWLVVFDAMRVYDAGRLLPFINEVFLMMKAHGLALLYFIALTYMFEQYKYSRLVMIYFSVLAGVSIAACHFVVRASLRRLRARGFNLKQVLIVGDSAAGRTFVERVASFPELGMRVAGIVTERHCTLRTVQGVPVLGCFEELQKTLRANDVHEVLIALPHSKQDEADRIFRLLKDETIGISVVPDVQNHVTLGCAMTNFGGIPIVRINDSPLAGYGALAKRITDIVLSVFGLIVLSPVLGVIALLIKFGSPGPALYRQERMGMNGRTFFMLKFRSMRVDAERTSGAVWANAGDNRRTLLGTILRRTSLDELPQLWNVLVGDMSLVGPRPERPVFVSKFRDEIPSYMLRHKVKAGMTGWAQINGWRGDSCLDSRVQCDLFYIRNWSYTLDIKILTLTLWKGFVHKNAY